MLTRICFFLCLGTILSAQNKVSNTPVPVKESSKWGFIDGSGKLIISAIYDYVEEFNTNGLCVVELDKKLGIINKEGKSVIPCQYDLVKIVDSNIIMVKHKGIWELRNLNNELLVSDVGGNVKPIGRDFMIYEKVSGNGLAHISKGKLTEPIYENFSFVDSYDLIKINKVDGKAGFIDFNGKTVIPVEFDDVRALTKCFAVKKDKHWAIFTKEGFALTEHKWDQIKEMFEDFITVFKNEKTDLFSLSANKVILDNYKTVKYFQQNNVIFSKTEGHFGLLDINGNVVLPDSFHDIQQFNADIYRVQSAEDLKWSLYNSGNQSPSILKLDYIGPLEGSIAKVSLDGLYGAINAKGEITLQIKYPVFNIENNNIKLKIDKNLTIFTFDENGRFEEEAQFSNFKTLVVELNQNLPNTSRTNFVNPREKREINDSMVWMFGKNNKFGIFNTKTNQFVLAPSYDKFINYPELNFCLAEISKREIGGELRMNSANATINSVWVVINNQIGKPVTKPELIHVQMSDFLDDSLNVARCIFVGGKYGLINNRGKILMKGMTYIGEFQEGKAACTKTGTLALDMKGKISRNLGNAVSFFNNLICRYEFDGFSLNTLSKGVVYSEDTEWGFIGTDGKWIVDGTKAKYEHVVAFSNERAMVYKNKKWGLIDARGELVLPLVYDDMNYIPNSNKNLFYIAQNQSKTGYIDNEARVIVPLQYEKLRNFSEGLVAVRKGSLWGFVNEKGEEVVSCSYRMTEDFSEGLAAVYNKGSWGFIDKSGNFVIKTQFMRVGKFKEGIAWVQNKNGQIVYINQQAEIVLQGEFSKANEFENGLARVYDKNKGWGVINVKGEWIAKPKKSYLRIEEFNEYGLAKVKMGSKGYAMMNRNGDLVTKGVYDEINDFSEGYAIVRRHGYGDKAIAKNTNYGIIDSTGKEICKSQFKQLGAVNNGLCYFTDEDGKYGFVNPQGETVVPAQFFKAGNFQSGRAIVHKKYNESGLIDTNGNFIVAPNVSTIMDVSEELALVKASYASYYFLREDLQRQSPNNFQAAHRFSDGVAPVQISSQWGVINSRGLKMITPKYYDIDAFDQGYAKVKIQQKQGVVNAKGEVVIPPAYEYVAYSGNGLFRVENGNSVGYLNETGAWVWEMKE